jgi:c-di-GMP-binding flagellar brake protein YcgR
MEISPDYQRRFVRYAIDIHVRFSIQRGDGVTTTCTARGTNVSEGGMALIVKEELRIGLQVRVAMTLPGLSKPIIANAKICNRLDSNYGIQFTNIAPADLESLINACKNFAEIPGSNTQDRIDL